jgi:hypothetical protein
MNGRAIVISTPLAYWTLRRCLSRFCASFCARTSREPRSAVFQRHLGSRGGVFLLFWLFHRCVWKKWHNKASTSASLEKTAHSTRLAIQAASMMPEERPLAEGRPIPPFALYGVDDQRNELIAEFLFKAIIVERSALPCHHDTWPQPHNHFLKLLGKAARICSIASCDLWPYPRTLKRPSRFPGCGFRFPSSTRSCESPLRRLHV